MSETLEFHEIQGIILSGYGHLPAASYVFLRIDDRTPAQQWLARISELATSAAPWPRGADGKIQKPSICLNIAFSPSGLDKLGVSRDGFSTEFCEGVAGPVDPAQPQKLANRSQRLGDTGVSSPQSWEIGGPNTPTVDILLMLFGESAEALDRFCAEQLPPPEAHALTTLAVQDAYQPEHDREPFGFMDGLSQPIVEGAQRSRNDIYPGTPPVKAGEFLLGYRNQYGLLPAMPPGPLGRNGSYLVYRKMEQDVPAFWNFVYRTAGGDAQQAELLAAKMVGRWRSGAPLTLRPDQDDPELGRDYDRNNCFEFATDDMAGYRCPVGSHVRRSNPRDALEPGPKESLDNSNKHRLIRRGRVYGPAYHPDVVERLHAHKREHGLAEFAAEQDEPRGLIFIAINADIKRQFEFVQQTWINDPKFDGLYDNKDPLIGNIAHDDQLCNMTIQRYPLRKQVRDVPRFVTLRAAGYFFLPSMSGLRELASRA